MSELATLIGRNLRIDSPIGVIEGSHSLGFSGIVVGTVFGTPAEGGWTVDTDDSM
jgi:hypothetical protein